MPRDDGTAGRIRPGVDPQETSEQAIPERAAAEPQAGGLGLPGAPEDRVPRPRKKLTDWLTHGGLTQPAESQSRELVFDLREGQTLTPMFLTTQLLPYLLALDELKRMAELLNDEPQKGLTVRSIVGDSVVVAFEGSQEALQWVVSGFEKWRMVCGDKLAALEEEKLAHEIEAAKIDLALARQANRTGRGITQADVGVAEAEVGQQMYRGEQAGSETASLEVDLVLREEAVRQAQVQIRKGLFDLDKEKFQLAVSFVNAVRPNMGDQELLPFSLQAKRQIDVMLDTKLQLKSNA